VLSLPSRLSLTNDGLSDAFQFLRYLLFCARRWRPDNHARGAGVVETLAERALRGLTVDGDGEACRVALSLILVVAPEARARATKGSTKCE
jgi:hypothetical protein